MIFSFLAIFLVAQAHAFTGVCLEWQPEWNQCTKDNECAVIQNPCGWPSSAANIEYMVTAQACNRAAGAGISCLPWDEKSQGARMAKCLDGRCINQVARPCGDYELCPEHPTIQRYIEKIGARDAALFQQAELQLKSASGEKEKTAICDDFYSKKNKMFELKITQPTKIKELGDSIFGDILGRDYSKIILVSPDATKEQLVAIRKKSLALANKFFLNKEKR